MDNYIYWPGLALTALMVVLYGVLWVWAWGWNWDHVKVWWHCLLKSTMLKTNHRMSELTILKTGQVYHFCSCGYLEPDDPNINWNSA